MISPCPSSSKFHKLGSLSSISVCNTAWQFDYFLMLYASTMLPTSCSLGLSTAWKRFSCVLVWHGARFWIWSAPCFVLHGNSRMSFELMLVWVPMLLMVVLLWSSLYYLGDVFWMDLLVVDCVRVMGGSHSLGLLVVLFGYCCLSFSPSSFLWLHSLVILFCALWCDVAYVFGCGCICSFGLLYFV